MVQHIKADDGSVPGLSSLLSEYRIHILQQSSSSVFKFDTVWQRTEHTHTKQKQQQVEADNGLKTVRHDFMRKTLRRSRVIKWCVTWTFFTVLLIFFYLRAHVLLRKKLTAECCIRGRNSLMKYFSILMLLLVCECMFPCHEHQLHSFHFNVLTFNKLWAVDLVLFTGREKLPAEKDFLLRGSSWKGHRAFDNQATCSGLQAAESGYSVGDGWLSNSVMTAMTAVWEWWMSQWITPFDRH